MDRRTFLAGLGIGSVKAEPVTRDPNRPLRPIELTVNQLRGAVFPEHTQLVVGGVASGKSAVTRAFLFRDGVYELYRGLILTKEPWSWIEAAREEGYPFHASRNKGATLLHLPTGGLIVVAGFERLPAGWLPYARLAVDDAHRYPADGWRALEWFREVPTKTLLTAQAYGQSYEHLKHHWPEPYRLDHRLDEVYGVEDWNGGCLDISEPIRRARVFGEWPARPI